MNLKKRTTDENIRKGTKGINLRNEATDGNRLKQGTGGALRKRAMRIILLFGVISLLGDMLYEGARGVNGPYLQTLGANAAIVGLVAGAGELLGYALRLVSGYLSDRKGMYWAFIFAGYGMIAAVPLMALTGVWQIASIFILVERIGKALRAPSKDAILSRATKQVGTGWGFGIHEFMDQIGAVSGPLIFSAVFIFFGSAVTGIAQYQLGYAVLVIPFVLMMAVIIYTSRSAAELEKFEPPCAKARDETLTRTFWLYTAFTFLSAFGLVSFILVGYHLKVRALADDWAIAAFYALAMLVDAFVALAIGKLYDRLKERTKNPCGGLTVLVIIPVFSMPLPFLLFTGDLLIIAIGVILWGVVMASHECIMRAAIADLTAIKKRGTGYGIFNSTYGLAMFLGATLAGVLYETSLGILQLVIVFAEVLALFVFLEMYLQPRRPGCASGREEE